jgi:Uma2 family endonuclease
MSAAPALWQGASRSEEDAGEARLVLSGVSFPLVLRLPQPLDDDSLLRFCAVNDALRFERTAEGDLVVMTPAGGNTGNRELYIARELDLWVEAQGKGIAFNSNVGFTFPDGAMRSPDAAWLSDGKWDALTKAQREKFLPVCPEFVIELRSPSDRISDLLARMEFWMSRGALLGWLIDPQRQLAMIYRPNREPETLLHPELLTGEGPVEGFSLKMQRLWD